LDAGADVNALNEGGESPLAAASKCYAISPKAYEEIAGLLLNRGANIESVDCFGRTPLMNAFSLSLEYCEDHVVSFLLDRGARASDWHIRAAAEGGHGAALEMLLKSFRPAPDSDYINYLLRLSLESANDACSMLLMRQGGRCNGNLLSLRHAHRYNQRLIKLHDELMRLRDELESIVKNVPIWAELAADRAAERRRGGV
jgi:hypothetical protein